jgi:hypothetical protein
LTESEYLAATDRTSGNKPGIASSKLNNKALRQANFVTSQVAEFLSGQLSNDVLDNNTPLQLLGQIKATFKPYAPLITRYTSGTGTHSTRVIFYINTGNATSGATYTNNGQTFTVVSTIASGVELICTGTGAPAVSGTLTKSGGTGDTTLTFYAYKLPLFIRARLIGAGGGGGANGGNGGAGGNTTFGNLTAAGGSGGTSGQTDAVAGGAPTVGAGWTALFSLNGSYGNAGGHPITGVAALGSSGGTGPYGGNSGQQVNTGSNSPSGVTNSGSGGAGAANGSGAAGNGGGGGGAYVEAQTSSTPSLTYSYGVGAAGTAGSAGGGNSAGAGGSGLIVVEEYFQ